MHSVVRHGMGYSGRNKCTHNNSRGEFRCPFSRRWWLRVLRGYLVSEADALEEGMLSIAAGRLDL